MLSAGSPPAAMSLTSRERHNPPPRQKSCAACIKAKRRCDAAFPACLRCAQRGIQCELPAGRRSRRGPQGVVLPTTTTASSASAPTPPPSITTSSSTTTTLPEMLAPVGGIPAAAGDPTCASIDADFFNSLDPMLASADAATFAEEPGLGEPFNFSLETLDGPYLELIHRPSMVLAPVVKEFGVLPDVVWRKLHFTIEQIKKAPRMMVLETQTPWSHPKLYEMDMPRSMQDAHACCALYMSKNRVNAPIIFRSIESRLNDLLALPQPATPLESLAHTQALILYHIIRVFDGDIVARASADRTQGALEDSAMNLLTHISFDVDTLHPPGAELPLDPLAPTRLFWREWLFQESARRTLLFTFFFLQAYRILSGQPILTCDGRLGMCHAYTLSAQLWHAETPVEFARRWGERRHKVVTNLYIEKTYRDARAEDVDAFGKMMLTGLIGVEDAEGWFAERGGSLWEGERS